ncbi:2'-5' RNA ligase family protein [Chitinimonas naiadis]
MSESRLFLALWPNEAVRKALHAASAELMMVCGGRRTLTAKLHLTLAFLGDVPADQRPALLAALAKVQMPAGVLRLDQTGFWQPGIAWLGLQDAPAFLLQLAADIRRALDEAGVDYDRKAFRPHVTLLRRASGTAVLPAVEPIIWPLEGYCLVESHPFEAGAPYRVLARFP